MLQARQLEAPNASDRFEVFLKNSSSTAACVLNKNKFNARPNPVDRDFVRLYSQVASGLNIIFTNLDLKMEILHAA